MSSYSKEPLAVMELLSSAGKFEELRLSNQNCVRLTFTLVPAKDQASVEFQVHLPTFLEELARTIEWYEAPPMRQPTPAEFVSLFRSHPKATGDVQQTGEVPPTAQP